MASIGIRSEINYFANRRLFESVTNQNAHAKPCFIAMRGRLSMSMSMSMSVTTGTVASTLVSSSYSSLASSSSSSSSRSFNNNINNDNQEKGTVVYEKVEEWMRNSVVEIVKNLREAPLLVHIYSKNDGVDGQSLKTEKAVEEGWPILKEKWATRYSPPPEGLIFVDQLVDDDDDNNDITKVWGIVVQGKGADCGPVCYLLKTSKVGVGSGLGLWCTHFCLTKVKSFNETARSQLKNCWLLQAQ